MSDFPGSPRTARGGLLIVDPTTLEIQRSIYLQYNPGELTRTLEVQSAGDGGDRMEALRLVGPPVETIQLEAEIDAADQLEYPDSNESVVTDGLHATIAALETTVYPQASQLAEHRRLLNEGAIEIAPAEGPLTLFTWSALRKLPVRITQFSLTEEFFDPKLNPIRAKVSLSMRVLRPDDLGLNHPAAGLFDAHHREKEILADASLNDGGGG